MNQRRSGHNWERELAERLSHRLGITFLTSRSESRRTDDRGVDFVAAVDFPIEFQAKEQTFKAESKSYSIKIEALDNMISNKKRALLVRMWKKKKDAKRRTHHGNYMVVDLEFGLELLECYDKHRNEGSTSTSIDQ